MLRIATRASALARWQAEEVARRLRETSGLDVELVPLEVTADRRLDVPISAMGGQGVFVKEVQAALLDGRADLAVHSAKDLPSTATPGLTLASFPLRGDPRDALVGRALGEMRPGATIATGSVRRRAQLAAARPDLAFVGLRGNIATRLGKVPDGGAVVVALAALQRLGLTQQTAEVLDPGLLLPQVAQATLAVECRADDEQTRLAAAAIDDPAVRLVTETERAFLARLGGGCDLPVAAYARLEGGLEGGTLVLDGLVATLDGRHLIRDRVSAPAGDGAGMGATLAAALLAAGGEALLADRP